MTRPKVSPEQIAEMRNLAKAIGDDTDFMTVEIGALLALLDELEEARSQ